MEWGEHMTFADPIREKERTYFIFAGSKFTFLAFVGVNSVAIGSHLETMRGQPEDNKDGKTDKEKELGG